MTDPTQVQEDWEERLAALAARWDDSLPVVAFLSVYGDNPGDKRFVADLRAALAAVRSTEDALRWVVANEGNHYDRYWTPPPDPLTDEWLADTEAKMREALTDVFCDDAAAVMLTLIAEIRRLAAAPPGGRERNDDECGFTYRDGTCGLTRDEHANAEPISHEFVEPAPPPAAPPGGREAPSAADLVEEYIADKPEAQAAITRATAVNERLRAAPPGEGGGEAEIAPVPYDEHERQMLAVIQERDAAQEWADRLAYAVAPVERIGEHSSHNLPWRNTLDILEARAAAPPGEPLDRGTLIARIEGAIMRDERIRVVFTISDDEDGRTGAPFPAVHYAATAAAAALAPLLPATGGGESEALVKWIDDAIADEATQEAISSTMRCECVAGEPPPYNCPYHGAPDAPGYVVASAIRESLTHFARTRPLVGMLPPPPTLSRLAALAEKAAPGPWRAGMESCDCGDGYGCGHPPYVYAVTLPVPHREATPDLPQRDYDYAYSEVSEFTPETWEFIVACRDAFPPAPASPAAGEGAT